MISMMKQKEKLRKRLRTESCPNNKKALKGEFARLRKEVKITIKNCFSDYVSDCEDKIKSNAKCFFAFTKSLRKTNSLPNSMKFYHEEASEKLAICNVFSKYFSSVYNPVTQPVAESTLDAAEAHTNSLHTLTDMFFTPGDVESALKGFDMNKVSCPDAIPMMFFMQLFLTLSKPLSILFNKSLREGKFPSMWKVGYVSPVHKEGDKGDVTNYRPVTIISAASKVFKRLVFDKIRVNKQC